MRRLSSGAAAAADIAAIWLLWPDWSMLRADVASPRSWIDRTGSDGAAVELASAALWCLATWLAVGLLAVLAGAVPGAVGQVSSRLAHQLLPAVVLRTLVGAAGVGVTVASLGAVPAAAQAAESAAVRASTPTPSWPTDTAPAPRIAIGWPALPEPIPGSDPPSLPPKAGARTPAAGSLPLGAVRGDAVTVRPGDSLWLIAARRLGSDAAPPAVAAAWPRWYAANQTVIGGDPGLITPGQVLRPPATPSP